MPPCAMTEGFEDYLRERRERSERTRHLLVGVLACTCIALAVSNVFLALRLTAGRARPGAEPPARAASMTEAPARPAGVTEAPARTGTGAPARPAVAPQAPAPSASVRADIDGPAPAVTLPKMSEATRPEPAEHATPSAPAEPAARADAPEATVERPSDSIALPPRSSVASTSARRAAPARAMTTPPPAALAAPAAPPTPAAPEEVTAAWMLTTYGRGDAEARARAALEFYNAQSAEGRYWRRVLALITAAR